jgi:hypothetical protein
MKMRRRPRVLRDERAAAIRRWDEQRRTAQRRYNEMFRRAIDNMPTASKLGDTVELP